MTKRFFEALLQYGRSFLIEIRNKMEDNIYMLLSMCGCTRARMHECMHIYVDTQCLYICANAHVCFVDMHDILV